MKKLICALIGVAALVASATTYIQTSATGTAPWRPVKDSVSQAHLADSARVAWFAHAAAYADNAATATKLATARTIGISGDVTGTATAFDGTANITIPTTLPTLLTAGSAGSATSVPTLTWDAKGRLTAAGSAAISIPHAQISDWGTYINQPLLTTSSPTFAGSTMSNLVLVGTESNNITNVQLANSVITTNPPTSLASQKQGLQFNWYSSNYVLGIIRGNGTDDQGFGITYGGGSNLRWRCTNGTTYDYNALTVSGLITANGGIIGQGNVGSSAQPWNAGYFSTAGIDIGGGLLTFNSPSTSTALLGVTAHPMVIGTATGSVAFPAGIGLNGPLGLSVVSVGGTTYSASAHKGRILTIAPSTTFTLPLGSDGDWFIIQGSAAQGQHQDAGTITPSGTTIYIRGTAYSGQTSVIGTLIAYCNGVYWYIG